MILLLCVQQTPLRGKKTLCAIQQQSKILLHIQQQQQKSLKCELMAKVIKIIFFIPPFPIDQLRNSNMVNEHLKSMKENIL
jgi:hypothetical protein